MSSAEPASGSGTSQYAGTWTLDTDSTSIEFQTKAMWIFNVKGSMRAVGGSGTVAEDGSLRGELQIDAASISTGNKRRDDHLRSADFFEVEKYPTVSFEASGATPDGAGQAEIIGTLTIRDQSRALAVASDVEGDGDAITILAHVDDIDRSQWGLTWAKMGAGLHNRVEVKARFTRG